MTGVQTCALPICFPVTIGGITHIGRNQANGILGYSDDLLKNQVITHRIIGLYIKGNCVYAKVEIFSDLNQYAPEELKDIKQLLRMLNNNVEIGVSLVVDGEWAKKDAALIYINKVMGFDFTLDPAFGDTRVLN